MERLILEDSHDSHEDTWQGDCPDHVPHGRHEVKWVRGCKAVAVIVSGCSEKIVNEYELHGSRFRMRDERD